MTNYTLRTVPFRIMRPTALSLSAVCQMVLAQVYTKDWEHKELAAKVLVLKEKTGNMRGVTRHRAIANCAAWYGVALELAGVVEGVHPQLAKILKDATARNAWVEPAWEYMIGQGIGDE